MANSEFLRLPRHFRSEHYFPLLELNCRDVGI